MMGSSRVKEGERNERAVRALLKLPGNRRCINCNSMGPQYVCTSFSTFICTNCSGIHREFTHRVKSISMAKFTSQEVSALQEGGNERAKGIYFKHLDFQGQPVPDSSDVDWLRNFIKNVYVGQRYTGKIVGDHPPQAKGIQAASYGNHDADSSSGVLRGPYGGTSEDNHDHQHIKGSTSGNQSNVNRHPIDDIMDEKNRYTMGKESANVRKRPDEFWKTAGSSENIQKDVTTSLSSAVEPSKDTTRVVLPVRLPNPPMSHKATPSTTSSEAQKVEPPRAGDPSPKTTRDVKVEMPKSLIDFDSDLEPHQGGAQAKIQNNSSLPSADVGWATFDVATPKNAISTPQSSFPTMQTAKSLSFPQTNHGGQQQQLFMFPVDNAQSYNAHLNGASSAPVSTQGSGAASDAPMQGSSALPSNHGSNILRGTSDPVILLASQQPSAEVASNGRKALPEDIFTMSYRPAYASTWDWRAHPRVNMGYGQYGVQYPVGTINAAQSFAHPNSLNSFNMSRGPLLVHAPTFPSLSSMQGPLPDMGSMSYVPSMASVLTSPQVPFSLTTNNNQFMVQQHAVNVPHHMQNNNFPVGYEGFRGFATTGSAYSISSMDQHMDAKSLRAIAQSSLPRVGGNPFA